MISGSSDNNSNGSEVPPNSGGTSDSFTRYLQQISRIDLLSDAEQHDLCLKIEDTIAALRRSVFRFYFAADEYLRLLNECLNGTIALADCFQPSSIDGDHNTNPAQPGSLSVQLRNRLLQLWKDFSQLRTQQKEALASGDIHRARELNGKLFDLSEKLTVSNDTIDEWLNIISNYLQMAGDDSGSGNGGDTPLAMTEERFGMPIAEAAAINTETGMIREKLQQLRHQLLESNLRLVVNIARRYQACPLPISDLVQEGNIGLLRALERFDFKLGNKFSTYASWWIRRNITRAIGKQSRIIRLPGHMITSLNAMNCAEQRFIQSYSREPEDHELAAMLEMPQARISALRKMARQPLSLQAPAGNDEDGNVLEDLISDRDADNPADEYNRALLFKRIYQMLDTLPERDRQIIVLRFGLFGHQPMGLREISEKMNLTGERIRQIEQAALKKLRSPAYLKYIDNCMH